MKELNIYVDSLFKRYRGHSQILELKEEILGNLEAKIAHLTDQGMDEKAAIEKAKNSITSIDHLIDENISVRISQFQFKAFQTAYLYIIITWIITIPFALFREGVLVNYSLLFVCLILGIVYIVLARNGNSQDKIGQINIVSMLKMRRVLWVLWAVFIVITWVYISALLFGSNIWFARPVRIDGPYQFGLLITRYALPFTSIVIPLIFTSWVKLISNYEVGEEDE